MFGLQLPLTRKLWVTLFETLQIKWEVKYFIKKSSCVFLCASFITASLSSCVCLLLCRYDAAWCCRWLFNTYILLFWGFLVFLSIYFCWDSFIKYILFLWYFVFPYVIMTYREQYISLLVRFFSTQLLLWNWSQGSRICYSDCFLDVTWRVSNLFHIAIED